MILIGFKCLLIIIIWVEFPYVNVSVLTSSGKISALIGAFSCSAVELGAGRVKFAQTPYAIQSI
jgi:hypothetical protein